MKISTKLILLLCFVVSVVSVVLTGISTYRLQKLTDHNLVRYQSSLMDSYDQMIKGQVLGACSILAELNRQVVKGELSLKEAQKRGTALLRAIRYGEEGYFWVDTVDGFNILHGNIKSYEGKNRIDLKDTKGKFLIQEIIENGRKPGGGYTDYWFAREEASVQSLKRGYSLEFKPWGWIVGTGNYIDDINKILDDQLVADTLELNTNLKYLLLFSAITIIVCVFLGWTLARKLTLPLRRCAEMANQIVTGNLETKMTVESTDEVGQLTEAMNEMVDGLRTNSELRRLSRTDNLTNMNNRRYFVELLDEALHKAVVSKSPLTIMLFDLDHFKLVNDTYGHAVGDDVLRMVSVVVDSFGLRPSDFWGRLGGEEFAIVLLDTRISEATVIVEQLRNALSRPEVSYGNGTFQITVSIGVAESWSGDDSLTLLKRADLAMYRAKANGRNQACFVQNEMPPFENK